MQESLSTSQSSYTEKQEKKWDGLTLEEVIRMAVRQGSLELIANFIKFLPSEKQAQYREIAKDELSKMKGEKK